MSTPSIARISPMPHISATDVETLAATIGVARGVLQPGARLCTVEPADAEELRHAARTAIHGRSWRDAEYSARDAYAVMQYGKTFNCCTTEQQNAALQRVRAIVHATRLYVTGDIEPLTEWGRAQAQPGARPALIVRHGQVLERVGLDGREGQ